MYNVGDNVYYCGLQTKIAAVYQHCNYIVDYPNGGWLGITHTLLL